MHDILAVFLKFKPQPPVETIFMLFASFLQRFLPYVYDETNCIFLRHVFKYIDLLIQYHDPGIQSVKIMIHRTIQNHDEM